MTETIIYKINKNYVKYSQLDIIKDISIITEYIEIYKSETYVYYYAVNYNNYNNDNYVVFTNERFMEINNGTITAGTILNDTIFFYISFLFL